MCGIIGFVGSQAAAPILIGGLNRLEYRGYDSAGLATVTGDGLQVRKLAGRVGELANLVQAFPVSGSCGIAHTRWATHGAPTEANAHPHLDCGGDLAVVHNGIIENADILRERLEWAGHRFITETDTEALAHLIEDATGDTLEARVMAALEHVEGTYGLAVVSRTEPDKIVVARQGSPVLVGIGTDGLFVASDPAALVEHTRSMVCLNDGEVAVLRRDAYQVLDADARVRVPEVADISWDLSGTELKGQPHFMLKEIREQPETIRATTRGRLLFEAGTARLNGLKIAEEEASGLERIVLLGCGTSWHAALAGREIIEALAQVPVQAEYASEYRDRRLLPQRNTLTIAISQSGETADTLEAMRAARASGSRVLGIVNVVGSTIARESDGGIYLHAGPELGVASTKAFSSQLLALDMLGLHLGRHRGMVEADGRTMVCQLAALPDLVAETLALEPLVQTIAEEFAGASNALYLGRGVNFPVALEGALKLREVSGIHAEAYPAAESKHGPIALIDRDMPVVVVAPRDACYSRIVTNLQEVRARGGRIVAVTTRDNGDLGRLVDHQLRVPAVSPLLSPILTVLPLQMLAYHIAVRRGCSVDRPRNRAPSVTVQ